MSGKANLRLNWMLKFSSWSANWKKQSKKKFVKSTFVFIWHPPRHIGFHTFFDDSLSCPMRVRNLLMRPAAFVFSPCNLESPGILLVLMPWSSAMNRQRANVSDISLMKTFFVNKTKKPLQWNNLMLYNLLVETFPILFRFLPNYLKTSLVLLGKKVILIKLISVSFKKNKQELIKILFENVHANQVMFIWSSCWFIILVVEVFPGSH